VSSYAPTGSGFVQQGGVWVTEDYASAAFGGLKSGVGLLLDLGSPRRVSRVVVPVRTPGLTVRLLAGDSPPTGGASPLPPAGPAVEATGARVVLLPYHPATERYWMVWVSTLAPSGQGYRAALGSPTVF
jgi:hypothetical protein